MVHFISRRVSWWTPGTIAPQPQYFEWTGGQTANTLGQADWIEQVRAQAINNQVLVCVHGFNTNRTGMLNTVKQIRAAVKEYGFDGAVVAYDWPTGSDEGIRGLFNLLLGLQRLYKKDKATANAMDDTLVKDLQPLCDDAGLSVHLLAHSMGCYLTTLAIGHAEQWLGATIPFDQIAFGAADVDQDLLVADQWGGKAVNRRGTRTTHYHSIEDDILDVSGQVMYGGGKRSGKHGLKDDSLAQFEDVSIAERYGAAYPKHKQNMRLSHNWYLRDSHFLCDLAITLSGKAAANMPTRRIEHGRAILKEG